MDRRDTVVETVAANVEEIVFMVDGDGLGSCEVTRRKVHLR